MCVSALIWVFSYLQNKETGLSGLSCRNYVWSIKHLGFETFFYGTKKYFTCKKKGVGFLFAREKLGFIDNGWSFLRQNNDQSGKQSKSVKPALETYRHKFGIYSISRPLIDN